jgi:hypothetical protein
MNVRPTNVRDVAIGLLTGVSVTLAMAQAPARGRQPLQPAAEPAPVVRYQITASRDNLGNEFLFILDHQTQQVHRVSARDLQGRSLGVADMIRNPG